MDDKMLIKLILEKLEKIDDDKDDKHEEIKKEISDMRIEFSKRLDKYNYELEKHIARNENFESDLNNFRRLTEPIITKYTEDEIVRRRRKESLTKFLKYTTGVSIISGCIYGIIELVTSLNGFF